MGKLNMSFIGIDDHKLKENGINDIWGFYLAMGEKDQVSYKNVSNITGKKIKKKNQGKYQKYSRILLFNELHHKA